MKPTLTAIVLTAGGFTAVAGLAPAAQAAPAADVTVTIQAEGTDMFGTVASSDPARCAAHRTVKVYKVTHGKARAFASDTTERQGGTYVWSTGNTGTEGFFFAKVAAKAGCNEGISPTIRVHR